MKARMMLFKMQQWRRIKFHSVETKSFLYCEYRKQSTTWTWCMGGPKRGRTQAGADEGDFGTLFNRIVIAGNNSQELIHKYYKLEKMRSKTWRLGVNFNTSIWQFLFLVTKLLWEHSSPLHAADLLFLNYTCSRNKMVFKYCSWLNRHSKTSA